MTLERYCNDPEGIISFLCDGDKCDAEIDTSTASFHDSIRKMRDKGWRSKMESDGDWMHLCPNCKVTY